MGSFKVLMLRWLSIGLPSLLIIVGLPLALRLIPPNQFYGFRTTTAFSSSEVWYRLNFLTGLALIVAGIVGGLLVGCLFHGAFGLKPEVRYLTSIIVVALAMLISLLPVVIYSNRF